MGKLGATEVILIVVVIVLLFGGKKIPELMKGLGTGIKEFKNAAKGEDQAAATKKTRKRQNNCPFTILKNPNSLSSIWVFFML